jgi:hypothetical protein
MEGSRCILVRVAALDEKRGREISRYESRAEASKVVANVAYQPDLV